MGITISFNENYTKDTEKAPIAGFNCNYNSAGNVTFSMTIYDYADYNRDVDAAFELFCEKCKKKIDALIENGGV